MSAGTQPRKIVIVGGGIIGCCTAYYLTRHQSYNPARDSITIIEASGVAAAASGKAGGLVALWAYPKCIVPLSFQLHADLAAEYDGPRRWGYRRIHCARLGARGEIKPRPPGQADSVVGGGRPGEANRAASSSRLTEFRRQVDTIELPPDLDWLHNEYIHSYRTVGTPDDTAQILPYEFTNAMAELAAGRGAALVLGRVTAIHEDSGRVTSVAYVPKGGGGETEILEATDVVVCAGPWTRALHPAAPILGLRQHSVRIRTSRPLSAYMLFTEISLPTTGTRRSQLVTPEIFTRPDSTVWAGGDTDVDQPCPATADEVVPDEKVCDDIIASASALSDELWTGEVLTKQACYLPNIEGDAPGPVLGPTATEGLWLATGHSCWGIQNGPATGKVMAEYVFDGEAKSAAVAELELKNLGK